MKIWVEDFNGCGWYTEDGKNFQLWLTQGENKQMKKRCRCKTNARFARYGAKGSKSVNYWKPCPIHDKQDKKPDQKA